MPTTPKSQATKIHREKITVILTSNQIALLDEIAAIRREKGSAITRSALVRATISGAAEALQELLDCTSAQEICERLRHRLRNGQR